MANLLQKASIVLTPTAYDDGKVLCAKPSEPPYGDFDFSRNSAATRVNAQGLVENVQILSGNLVQNGDFSEEGAEEVSNGSFSQEGVELVTNGSFDTDSDWTKGVGWTISGGNANSDGVSSNSSLYQNVGGVNNTIYKITGTISNYVSGTLQVGGSSNFLAVNSNGDFVHYRQWTSDSTLYLKSVNFIGSIDNVSVKEVGQDWDLGTGWSIGEDKVIVTSTINQQLKQTLTTTIGKSYKVSLEILDITEGSIRIYLRDGGTAYFVGGTYASSGVYDFYFTSTETLNTFAVYPYGTTTASITNISVKEVGQNWALGDGWSIGDNIIYFNNPTGTELYQSLSTTASKYRISFDLDITSGTIQTSFSSPSTSTIESFTTSGTKEVIIETTSNYSRFRFVGIGNSDFSITNISVIEITDDTNLPRINYEGFSYQDALGSEQIVNGDFSNGSANWNFASSWSISGGKAICSANGGFGSFSQNNSLTIGKKYKITLDFDGSGITSGVIRMNGGSFSNPASERTLVDGENILYLDAISTSFGINESGAFGIATIDNVSVKEYLGQEPIPNSGCGHWLWEPQSTNLLPYSEDFSQWIGSGCTVGNSSSVVSPSNSNNIGIITGTIGTGAKFARINVITSSSILTYSAFFKYNSHQWVQFASGATSEYANFDIQNGVVGNKLSGTTSTIDNFGNGWYRCTLSTSVASTPSNMAVVLIDTANSSRLDDTSSVGSAYIWGAQLEQQSYATSYIPTNGEANGVTRNQDLCTNGGSLASINSTEGVLYAEIAALANDGTDNALSINNGSQTDRIWLGYSTAANRIYALGYTNSVVQFVMFKNLPTDTDMIKVAVKYKENDFALWVNGIEEATATSGLTPIGLNSVDFFINGIGSRKFFGKTKALAVWKEALSDEELTLLTAPAPVAPTFTLDLDTIATDFTFARGSEATYVDAQGLIQSTNEIGEEEVVNGDYAQSGVGNAISQSGGILVNENNQLKITSDGSSGFSRAVWNTNGLQGQQFLIKADIISTSGITRFIDISNNAGQNLVQGTTFSTIITLGGSASQVGFGGLNDASFELVIDNVSVKAYKTETNTPRLDYSTGAEAFLLEPQSTNLLTYSEDFSDAYWTGGLTTATITSSTNVNPSGENGTYLVENVTGSRLASITSVTSGLSYGGSIYVRNVSGSGSITLSDVNGTITSFTATDKWQRFSVTNVANSTTGRFYLFVTTQGDIIEIWGAQLEQQSYATSYIPTSGTSVTRVGETCVNATPEINSEEGVLYAEISALADDLTNRMIALSDSDSSDHVRIYYINSTNKISVAVKSNGSNQYVFLNYNVTDITDYIKIAVKYKANDFATFINGVKVNSQTTTASAPIGLDRLNFNSGSVASPFYGNTKDLQYFNEALSDYQLAQLTTI